MTAEAKNALVISFWGHLRHCKWFFLNCSMGKEGSTHTITDHFCPGNENIVPRDSFLQAVYLHCSKDGRTRSINP